jgi:hypothetical protein
VNSFFFTHQVHKSIATDYGNRCPDCVSTQIRSGIWAPLLEALDIRLGLTPYQVRGRFRNPGFLSGSPLSRE